MGLNHGRILNIKMAFVAAMNAPATRTVGVNGADVYTEHGVGDMRVAFYTSFVRGMDAAEIRDWVTKVRTEGKVRGLVDEYERDLWLLAFQGRDVRGGKGERTIALELVSVLLADLHKKIGDNWLPGNNAVDRVLSLVLEYGSWRDVFVLTGMCPEFEDNILSFVGRQFWNDYNVLKGHREGSLSLLAKWLPREKAETFKTLFPRLISSIYGTDDKAERRRYRMTVSHMNRQLDTVETHMCNSTWATIKPGAVPGKCLKNNRQAFFNNKLKSSGPRSEDPDRVTCAQNFVEHLGKVAEGKAKVNGGNTVYPHELVTTVQRAGPGSDEMKLLEAQWAAIKEKIAAGGHLGKVVPMCDFSGSMTGTPMQVSLGMGLLVSELNHPAFRNSLMTFDSTPKWITFGENDTLHEKITKTYNTGFGLSTNFEAAFRMVLDRLVEHKVPVGEEPDDFVVFTDMGFDEASGGANGKAIGKAGWETLVDKFQREFAAAGGWKMPRLIIWNLRSEYKNYHAKADQKGVLTLSGWSPSAMRVITAGAHVNTPYEAMRELLDAPRYDPVRAMLVGVSGPVVSASGPVVSASGPVVSASGPVISASGPVV